MRRGCRFIDLGGIQIIECGGEVKDHVCDDKLLIYDFSDGFRGTLFDKAKEEGLNLNMCDDDKMYFIRQRDIDVMGCSVACSICGRTAIDEIMWLI